MRSAKYRTLCDLPMELLSIIVSYVHTTYTRSTMVSCSLVCPCLRAVAIEHLFSKSLAVHDIESCDHFISFLQENPNVSHKIQALKLSSEVIDDDAVAKFMALLPKLANLELGRFICPPPSVSDLALPQYSPGPFALDTFRLDATCADPHPLGHTSSISSFFRILSLFHIKKLTMDQLHGENSGFDTSTPLDPRLLHRPLRINELRIRRDFRQGLGPKCIPLLTTAFGEAIEPGSLQVLDIRPDSAAAVSALGHLLARAGRDLRSLSVDGDTPDADWEGSVWEDPLDKNWHMIDLATCPKLEFFETTIYFRAPGDEPQPRNVPALSLAGAGMLSRAPGTLRKVSILVWDLPSVATLNDRRTLRLQAFDEVISADRFPVMKEVRVAIMSQWIVGANHDREWERVCAALEKALPGLHARGLLMVSWSP